ncbi:MAG: putative peptidoglycan lipid II flippase [Flavobacteriaceae bacterium]|jgi:putative peptidoglycan lipid II flippase
MKALLKLFSLKLITSLLGLVYSILQVRYFGASRTIEVYFAAQSLIYLVTSLTQSGQLAEIFLPEYHKLNTIKKGLGFKGLNIVINRMFLWGSLIIAIVFIFTPFFISLLVPGFSNEDKEQATLMFRILLPYLFLQINNSFFITVLNAEEKYGRAEFLGVTNTIVNILSLVILYPYIGVWALIISLLLGKLIEFVFYTAQLYKIGFKFRFLISMPEFNHKSFFKTMQSTFMYVGATQIYSVVLTASISFLPEGTYAIFKYVQNLANKVKGLFVQPFLTIFFTQYSKLLQKSKEVVYEFKKNMGSIINVNTVIIIGTVLLGDYIIELIWGSKKFDADNVKFAYLFLLFNIGSVLISSISSIYRKMTVAQGKAKRLYSFWVIAQLLSALFTYVLINNFKTNGLFFIIPLNTFLMGLTSFLVYKKTKNSINYNIFDSTNFIALILIVSAVILKFFILNYASLENKTEIIIILIFSTLMLSIYPILSTYKLYRNE